MYYYFFIKALKYKSQERPEPQNQYNKVTMYKAYEKKNRVYPKKGKVLRKEVSKTTIVQKNYSDYDN